VQLAPASAAVVQAPAPEEPYANINRKASLRVGGVALGSFGTTLQVSSDVGVGAVIDLEDLLGMKTSDQVLRIDGAYAFTKRSFVELSYYDISRKGSVSLAEDIEVGDVVIPAGGVRTSFGTEILELAYRYDFVADTRTRIGASLGLHVMRLDFGIESSSFDIEESFAGTLPLPVLGLRAEYALSRDWSLYTSYELFQLRIDGLGGAISDLNIGLNWDFSDHVGLGLEAGSFLLDAEAKDGDLEAKVRYGYQGLGLFLRGYL